MGRFLKALLCALLWWTPVLGQPAVPPSLCGRWTGYSSDSTYAVGPPDTLVLQQDGSYQSSGAAGRWWVDGEFFCLQTSSGETAQFYLEMRNNEYGEPMLILDGTPYVSAGHRDPWP